MKSQAQTENSTSYRKSILIESNSPISSRRFEIESRVTQIIREIGIPAHVKGYCYLRTAIIMTVENPDLIYAMTKELYPAVARHYGTTPQRVERAIRHAIELAWDDGDIEILSVYFSYRVKKSYDKPTNSEVIANLSDRIRLESRM